METKNLPNTKIYMHILIGTLILLLLLLIPNLASAKTYHDYFSAINGEQYDSESKVFTVVYDGQNHGFRFACIAQDIYDKKYNHTSKATHTVTIVFEDGYELSPNEFSVTYSSQRAYIDLAAPKAGVYTIEIRSQWHWFDSVSAKSTIILCITPADLDSFLCFSPYTGVYDGESHNAVCVTNNSTIPSDTYQIRYSKNGGKSFTNSIPMVKDVADSNEIICEIEDVSGNFISSPIRKTVSVSITPAPVIVTVQDATKCIWTQDPVFSYLTSELKKKDKLTGIFLTRDEGEELGDYRIVASQNQGANPNYNITFVSGKLIIKEHRWGSAVYSWSDDNSQLAARRTCLDDQTHYEEETVNTAYSDTPATCETPLMRVFTSGEFQNHSFVQQTKPVPIGEALGHIWSEEITYTWLASSTKVMASRVCNRDNEHVDTETVSVSKTITKQPTCTEKGERTYTSKTFKNPAFEVQVKVVKNVPALGHEWNTPIYTWATDNSHVTAIRICNHDNNHVETETANTMQAVTLPPTCTHKGQTTYTSEVFQNRAFSTQEKKLDNIEMLPHTLVDDLAVPATCFQIGLTEGSHCSVCGMIILEQQPIPMIPHTPVIDVAVAPTYEQSGLTEGSHCAICGEVLKAQQIVPALVPSKNGDSFSCNMYVLCGSATKTVSYYNDPACRPYLAGAIMAEALMSAQRHLHILETVDCIFSAVENGAIYIMKDTETIQLYVFGEDDYLLIWTTITDQNYAYSKVTYFNDGSYYNPIPGGWEMHLGALQYAGNIDSYYKITDTSVLLHQLCFDNTYDLMIYTHARLDKNYTGWTINDYGDYSYYLEGFPVVGLFSVDGDLYCFDNNGSMLYNTWFPYNSLKLYADEYGEINVGYDESNGSFFAMGENLVYYHDTLILPIHLDVIESEAFSGVSAQVIILPSSCESVSSHAFDNCNNLRIIVLNSAATVIDDLAFSSDRVVIVPFP